MKSLSLVEMYLTIPDTLRSHTRNKIEPGCSPQLRAQLCHKHKLTDWDGKWKLTRTLSKLEALPPNLYDLMN